MIDKQEEAAGLYALDFHQGQRPGRLTPHAAKLIPCFRSEAFVAFQVLAGEL